MARLRLILAVLIALFAVLTLLDRFVLIELMVRRLGAPILFASVEALACIGAGALLRRSSDRRRPAGWDGSVSLPSRAEARRRDAAGPAGETPAVPEKPVVGSSRADLPLDLLIGYPVLGTLCFLAGVVKVSAWTMLPLVVAGALWGAWIVFAAWRTKAPEAGRQDASDTAGWKPALLCVCVVLGCAFVAAQAPPSSLDEVAYHLAVPQTWVLEGKAIALPLLSHSWFPLGIESADLPSLALLGPVDGGIASHFLHLFAAVATTLLIARRTQSWFATAAIVTTPALAIIAGWSLVDWPLIGLFVALSAAENDDDASAVTAAGLLVKYTFLPFALLAWAWKRRLPRPIALLGLVYFVRNVFLTGNPLAPFFGVDAPHVAGYRALELAGYVFDGSFVDEAIGASILTLPLLATGGFALVCLAIAFGLFFLAPSSRILLPFLVVPAIDGAPALRRRVIGVLVAAAIAVQTLIVVWFTARSDAFSLLAGSASEEQYLRKSRPSYASIEWLNEAMPRGARALVIGPGETYWFARPVRGGGNFDGERVSRYLDVPTPEALRARLRADGITHIAVLSVAAPTAVEKKVQERQIRLSLGAQRMLARTLDRYSANVVSRGETALFTLR